MNRRPCLSDGLGVDLVEFEKAEFFYQTHQHDLSRIFNPKEVLFIRNHRKPSIAVAMILGAKEALYKAGCSRQPGLLEFNTLQTIPGTKKINYKIKLTNQRKSKACLKPVLSFIRKKRFIVVQCVPESPT